MHCGLHQLQLLLLLGVDVFIVSLSAADVSLGDALWLRANLFERFTGSWWWCAVG